MGGASPTAGAGRGKDDRRLNGAGLLGGALVVAVSWLLLAVIFPDVLPESRAAAGAFMAESGMPEDQVEAQMRMLEATTPMSQSIPGGIGTFFTSLVSGAVAAIWLRRK